MAAILKIVLGAIFLLILWGAGILAGHQHGSPTPSFLFAIMVLVAVWLLALVFALLPALSLYSPEHNSRVNFRVSRFTAVWNPSKLQILGYVATSYGTTIYVFSVIFVLVSNYDAQAFTPTIESLSTAAYFSIVTIATVGYGDIQPVSGWARFMASAEILIGVAYTVFFFSVIAGFLRERDRW
jgi:voltage-gated potassium channel Kch